MTDGRRDSTEDAIVLPGGWHVPPDQMPGWPFNRSVVQRSDPGPMHPGLDTLLNFPITAKRGGIKYPKRETDMTTSKLTAAQELKLAEETLALLTTKVEELREQAEKEKFPPAPMASVGDAFTVRVRFNPGPRAKQYRFLILRTPMGYYTTGTSEDDRHFPSWNALVAWLRGERMVWHSPMYSLDNTLARPLLEEWPANG